MGMGMFGGNDKNDEVARKLCQLYIPRGDTGLLQWQYPYLDWNLKTRNNMITSFLFSVSLMAGIRWTSNKSTEVTKIWKIDRDEHVHVGEFRSGKEKLSYQVQMWTELSFIPPRVEKTK